MVEQLFPFYWILKLADGSELMGPPGPFPPRDLQARAVEVSLFPTKDVAFPSARRLSGAGSAGLQVVATREATADPSRGKVVVRTVAVRVGWPSVGNEWFWFLLGESQVIRSAGSYEEVVRSARSTT